MLGMFNIYRNADDLVNQMKPVRKSVKVIACWT